ncbi:MAG: HesA/MoeB/ThiF family protein, partial [Desulfosudaceae bacterium]
MTEDKAIGDIIAEQAREIKDAANRPVRMISETGAEAVSRQTRAGLGRVYETALQAGIWPLRYLRHADTLSCAEQLRLARSGVAVIGAGGLGAAVVMLLARLGIGRLTVADPDVFEETNLNRQLPAARDTLGRGKAEAVQAMAADVNPAIAVRVFSAALG